MLREKVDKKVRLRWDATRRSHVSVVREHYFRDDISCKSELCSLKECQTNSKESFLISESTHYVLPDAQSLVEDIEVYRHPAVAGVIVTQTAAAHVRGKLGRNAYSRLLKLLPAKHSTVFANEHQLECFVHQEETETIKQWQQRLVLRCALWYYNHLQLSGHSHSIVLVTNNPQDYDYLLTSSTTSSCSSSSSTLSYSSNNILVMSMAEYLSQFLSHHDDLLTLYKSVVTSRRESEHGSKRDYFNYLPLKELKQGVLEHRFVEGVLRVNRHHPHQEAYVTVSSSSLSSLSSSPYSSSTSSPYSSLSSPYSSLSSASSSSSSSSSSVKDILIDGMKHRNRALHCDRVVVECLPPSDWAGPTADLPSEFDSISSKASRDSSVVETGVVVGVVDREMRDIVASFQEVDGGADVGSEGERSKSGGRSVSVLVVPYDIRYPKIRIRTHLCHELRNHRVVVRVDRWDCESQYPDGHFVRSIGPIGDIETETEAILVDHKLLRGSFTKVVLKEMPDRENWMDQAEVERRRDLRDNLVYSIDPKGCEDVDDALSVRKLKNGDMELGVHIADVSYFVRPDTHTDREARDRGTTVYLADRRDDMLPAVISADVCSLLSKVDRYAVSVVWKLSPQYEVKEKKVWYGRTIIRSSYKLTYEVAQELFDDRRKKEELIQLVPELQELELEKAKQRVDDLQTSIKQLVLIARELKKTRMRKGGVDLESVEVKVQFRDNGKIANLLPKQPLEMHEVIAECMIFANEWVAKRIHEHQKTSAMLRLHPPPRQDKFKDLFTCAAAKKYSIDTSSNLALAASLNKATDDSDPLVNRIMRILATQAMSMAEYFSTGSKKDCSYHHYGLGLDHYTHFTSPIRRYADIIVHRQLVAAINSDSLAFETLIKNSDLQDLCIHLNTLKKSSQLAQKEHTKLFQLLFFQGLAENDEMRTTRGVVYAIKRNGVMIHLPRYGIEGPVYLKDRNGMVAAFLSGQERLQYVDGTITSSEHSITITHSRGCYTLHLFDHLSVCVKVEPSRAHLPTFVFELLSHKPLSPSTYKPFYTAPSSSSSAATTPSFVCVDKGKSSPHSCNDHTVGRVDNEYSQHTNTLYCLVQRMRSVGQSLPV